MASFSEDRVKQIIVDQLGVAPERVLIGLEATSRYSENLYQFLSEQGYTLCLLHPRQTHQFAQQRGLRTRWRTPSNTWNPTCRRTPDSAPRRTRIVRAL